MSEAEGKQKDEKPQKTEQPKDGIPESHHAEKYEISKGFHE